MSVRDWWLYTYEYESETLIVKRSSSLSSDTLSSFFAPVASKTLISIFIRSQIIKAGPILTKRFKIVSGIFRYYGSRRINSNVA